MMRNISSIKTRNDIATFLGIKKKFLTYILYKADSENLYSSFTIPKKNGEERHIYSPKSNLKFIQKKLANALVIYEYDFLKKDSRQNVSHGFQKGKSFITNAKQHKNKRYVVNVDLENFFESIHFGRVRGYFIKNKNYLLPEEVATIIAQIVCYKGKLPQGAPTSPIISNMICTVLDMRIIQLAKKYKLNYSRYADDLSFSTNRGNFLLEYTNFLNDLTEIIEQSGFKVNKQKTRIQFKDSRQEVTGVVVNKRLNVNRKYYKTTRAMAHELYKSGNYCIDQNKGSIEQLEGRFSFINQLDKYNNELNGKKCKYKDFNSREKEYSKFLFYKYFFANSKPLIITEGKTDVRYLKAALKSLYAQYPKLIDKHNKDQYNVSFFDRTNRISYFLDIKIDGADTLCNIFKFYTNKDNNNYPNYINYLKKLSNNNPKNPVIIILDNELNCTERKPVKKMINDYVEASNKEKIKLELKNKNYAHIKDNLYLIVTPLIDGEQESDIEMLFDEEIQNIEIDGRKLDKTGKKDIKEYFYKNQFSKYILSNYNTINFCRFKPLLNNVINCIDHYNRLIGKG